MIIALVLAAFACVKHNNLRPNSTPPVKGQAATTVPSPPRPILALNGYGEDPFCPYIFTSDDSKTFESVLADVSADTPCKFDGAQGQFTRMIGTWIAPDKHKISMQFLSGACGSAPGKVADSPLIVSEAVELKRDCGTTYDAAVRALENGRLPKPGKRKDVPAM
jgi:hypothetical protein